MNKVKTNNQSIFMTRGKDFNPFEAGGQALPSSRLFFMASLFLSILSYHINTKLESVALSQAFLQPVHLTQQVFIVWVMDSQDLLFCWHTLPSNFVMKDDKIMNKFLIISNNYQMNERYQLNESIQSRNYYQNTLPLPSQKSRLKSMISPQKQNTLRQTSLLWQTGLHNRQQSMLRQARQMFDQAFAQEIFQRSVNRSYIGEISGKKQQFHQIKIDQIEESVDLSMNQSNIIGLSRFREEPLPQIKETLVTYQEARFMNIVAFSKQNEQLFKKAECMPCSTHDYKSECRIDLVHRSTIQIYTRGLDEKFDKLLLSFNFDIITVNVQFQDIPQNRQITITAGKYRLSLEHQSRDIVEWWFSKLFNLITLSKGNEFNLKNLSNTDQFYQQRLQSQQFFANNCQTGDIILFQDSHFFAKAQRFFTQSDFDHVGMVIKDLNYGTLIFQANSGSGVCLTPWKYVVKYQWYKSIPKIAWRRLRKVERNNAFNETIQKFVLQNLQKHYHISFAKITANQSIIRSPLKDIKSVPQKVNQQQDDTGFFCSELIATVYKQLGLLTRDISSSNYQPACKFYPKDFSERSGRLLDEGELSPQFTIYFDDNLLRVTQNA